MWRIFNGLSRGLRTRTPAPPSQSSPWPDENENTGGNTLNITLVEPEDKPTNSTQHQKLTLYQQSDRSIPLETEITQRILGSPSEADILLREYFGRSWKNKKSSNNQRENGCGCNDIPEHILSGVGLGTVWMTAIVLGRAALSSWSNHNRRSSIKICDENITTWQEFEHRYLSDVQDHMQTYGTQCPNLERQRRRMPMVLHVLPGLISRNPILAAGRDSNATIETSTGKPFHIEVVESLPRLKIDKAESPAKQKTVSFDKNCWDSSNPSSAGDSDELSEEAIERFTEDTRDCSGATYNILGLQSVKSGDYKEAFNRFRLGSRDGYAKSHFNLGLCYEKGLGTKKDSFKAMELYEKAAFKGHTKSQYNLALLHLEKGGMARKLHAIGLLEKAAMNGFVQAQSFLGAYLTKPGEFQDFKKAVKMFKMAAEQGDVNSKYHLGICYERGMGGLNRDLNKAFDLYSSAATADHLSAHYNMAIMLETGFSGTEKNPKVAQELLKSAAKLGHRPSSLRLKEIKRSQYATRETKHDSGSHTYNIYHSQGRSTTTYRVKTNIDHPQPSFEANPNLNESKQISKPDSDRSRSIIVPGVPSMLSRHISTLRVIDAGTQLSQLDVPQSSPVQLNFKKPTRLENDPVADAVHDFLSLRRVSTTPTNLCYHSPLVRGPMSAFSLEV